MDTSLTYMMILSENDGDISRLLEIYQQPDISQYLRIREDYFHYVTSTENVYYYKVYKCRQLIGAIHLELCNGWLYMAVLILPEYQKMGFATRVLADIQNDVFCLKYRRIEIAIDESNVASIKLFENAGFIFISKEDSLLNYAYERH